MLLICFIVVKKINMIEFIFSINKLLFSLIIIEFNFIGF